MYKSGTISNSYELTHIIHATMRDVGWELISGNSPNGIDSIFYSTGEDGYQNIYVKVAANQHDLVSNGDIQFPHSDGYNGFVNFYAYQYHDGTNGYGEIGRYGPALYFADGSALDVKIEMYDFATASYIGGGGDGYAGRQKVLAEPDRNSRGTYSGELFDGQRKLFFTTSGDHLGEVDLAEKDKDLDFVRYSFFTSCTRPAIWSRASAREPKIWASINGYNSSYGSWATYNTLTGTTYYVSGSNTNVYADFSWDGSGGINGWGVQGVRRNGSKYLYRSRGSGSATWARYDIDNNEWTNMSPALPYGSNYATAVYIMKENTGYVYDRIYVAIGNGTRFVSIAIDDNGDPVGSWVTHSNAPDTINDYDGLFYVGGDRIFLTFGGGDSLYRWNFPESPSDSGSWQLVRNPWFNEVHATDYYPSFHAGNHLCGKIPVEENNVTRYWIIANKDRVIVVTETYESSYSSDYNLAYVGLFETAHDDSFTTLTNDAPEGTTTIEVSDTSMFRVGQSYQIVYIGEGDLRKLFNGELRRSAKVSRITISEVKQSTSEIIISSALVDTFPEGSKIGEDVQPVGVFVYGRDEIQTLNNVNLIDDRTGDDTPFQIYKIAYPQQDLAVNSERTNHPVAWPVSLVHSAFYDDSTQITESDVRGALIGVYFAGDIDSENILEINDQNYIAFSIFNSSILSKVLVGPLE